VIKQLTKVKKMHVKAIISLIFCFLCLHSLLNAEDSKEVKVQRTFEFTYGGAISELPKGKTVHVWLPVAQNSFYQKVELKSVDVPGDHLISKEQVYGNKMVYFEAEANAEGKIPFSLVYEVERQEVTPKQLNMIDEKLKTKFLKANTMVPVSDSLIKTIYGEQKPKGTGLTLARDLYDKVDAHVKYDKPAGGKWGRGDTLWVCDSKHGNCTDFHSLFISLCRSVGIPGKFEIGFPLPTDKTEGTVGGYHCWAYFANSGKWTPVDISEADKNPDLKEYYFGRLTPDRVKFSEGRDINLVPKQADKPLNFFVYPYAEVDGKQHKMFEKGFKFKNIEK
jgi:hypothetical protein